MMQDDAFAPPPPQRSGFVGLDLGIVRLGIENGSVTGGVDLGFAGAEGSVGRHTGVRAGADLGPIGSAHGEAGATVDRRGIHAGAGAGAEALDLAGAGGKLGTDVGARTGVHGSVGGFAGPVDARLSTHAHVDPYGAEAAAKAKLRVQNLD
jgi:hypothetical protein